MHNAKGLVGHAKWQVSNFCKQQFFLLVLQTTNFGGRSESQLLYY
jgi:hypothetical protein